MDFITWWFETHYVASTILTPFFTWMWLLFTDGSTTREFVAAGWFFVLFMINVFPWKKL